MRSLNQVELFDVNGMQASEIERVEVYTGLSVRQSTRCKRPSGNIPRVFRFPIPAS